MDIVSESTEKGVTERRFDLKVGDEVVPGIWWCAEGASEKRPTILIGHGGTQHKRVPNVLGLARRFVRHQGWNAVAIDAPNHGDRVDPELQERARKRLEERIAAGRREGRPVALDPEQAKEMARIPAKAVPEWRALLDEVQTMPELGDGPYGYWGVSMGTLIGLPFCASEPRIASCVLGLSGFRRDRPEAEAFESAARSLTIPVLFVFQWDDELASREAGLEMFDAFASKDKAMHIHPGGHVFIPLHERDAYEAFFIRTLTASDSQHASAIAAAS